MTTSSLVKSILKAQGMSLILVTSGLLLAGCGGGGSADHAGSGNSNTQTENVAPGNGSGTGNNNGDSNQNTGGNSDFQAVRITSQPGNQAVSEGADVRLTVAAAGTGTLSYQWYFSNQAITGATSATLNLTDVTQDDSGSYYCVVRNSGSSANSSTANVSVVAAAVSGTARISWNRPTTRADGSALAANEIDGYTLYHADSTNEDMEMMTNELAANELSINVDDLSAGTHYFALSTRDTNGLESARSNRFAVTIQ